jgi:ABC-type transport system involved in multi-copper enzyme maturation permease subunit
MSTVMPVEPPVGAPPPAPAAAAPRADRFRALSLLLTRNPVVLKELRGRMRGPRAFIVLTLYLLLMSGFVTLLYLVYTASANSAVSGNSGQLVGKFVFGAVVGIELLLVCFIAPAFTAGAISGERERQTYDLLRTTLLPAQALVLGKLASALSYVLLLLVAAFPLQSLAFLLGGVGPQEVVIATLLLVATAFLFGTSGIFFSSLMRRTLGSTVVTYAFALMATLGLPLILVAVVPLGTALINNAAPGPAVETALIFVFAVLIATNPIATAVTTEILLVSQQSAFYFTVPLSNGTNLTLISPWLPYIIFCAVLGSLMTIAGIFAVRRAER